MSAIRRVVTTAAAVAYGLVAAASVHAAPDRGSKRDPNQMVCEKHEVLGTRLATKRVCKTRAEWAEERRLERQTIERAQVSGGCVKDAGC